MRASAAFDVMAKAEDVTVRTIQPIHSFYFKKRHVMQHATSGRCLRNNRSVSQSNGQASEKPPEGFSVGNRPRRM